MQKKEGVHRQLGGGGGTASPVASEVVQGSAGDAAVLGARRPEQYFIGSCPDCDSHLAFIEECAKCHVCGFSECG